MKSIWYYVIAIFAVALVVTVSRNFASPGQRDRFEGELLPDHITRVIGTTLPQAIFQSRQQGKGGVRVTDPNGNSIWVSTDSVTDTDFVVRGIPQNTVSTLQEGLGNIENEIPQFAKRQSIVAQDDTHVRFTVNVTNHGEVAAILYEISVRVFQIQSTSQWVIDLTDEPFDSSVILGEAGESADDSTSTP